MGLTSEEVSDLDAFLYKIVPLIFLIPLTLRIIPQTADIPLIGEVLVNVLNFDSTTFVYGILLFVIGLIAFVEMSFARTNSSGSFFQTLNAGAGILLIVGFLGLFLGTYTFATGQNYIEGTSDQNDFLDNVFINETIIPLYLVIGIIILFFGARSEIRSGIRLGTSLRNR
jgi:hypothetical protein